MYAEATTPDLHTILEAIRTSKVIENQIQLISQLAGSKLFDGSDLDSLTECLVTFWEDFTHLDTSWLMLYKSILCLAAKYTQTDDLSCLSHFLVLGTKANFWCRKHLEAEDSVNIKLMPMFCQLTLDILNFSSGALSALARVPIITERLLMVIVENFILEQLHLTKAFIRKIERIPSVALEVVKLSHEILDATIKLCKAHSEAVKWGHHEKANFDVSVVDNDQEDLLAHITNIVTCAAVNLYEIGTLAASGGGNLMMILNVSWKGLVSLLQLGGGVLSDKINIADIILTLISLATGSLRCAARAWSSTREDCLDAAEAKRMFLPIKFYLINAVRICSQYPYEALKVYKEITLCVVLISTCCILMSKEIHLKAAGKALVEFLEPTSLLLVLNMLNSVEHENMSKLKIVDWLFRDEIDSSTEDATITEIFRQNSWDELFMVQCEDMPSSSILRFGRFFLFLSILKNSPYLRDEIVTGISKKLGCLLELLCNPCIYSCILGLCVPVIHGSGSTLELSWNPMYSFVVSALKIFMVVASTGPAWKEMQNFLLANFIHQHIICREIVVELCCFFIRHAEIQMRDHVTDALCSLLKIIAALDPSLLPSSSLRRVARSVCTVLECGTQTSLDCAYSSIVDNDESQSTSVTFTALLVEGFPVNSLSGDLRKLANQRAISAFYDFIENENIILEKENSQSCICSNQLDLPLHAMIGISPSLQMTNLDAKDTRILKFVLAVIRGYKNCTCHSCKERYTRILSHLLEIVSNIKSLYASDIKELILMLHSLFVVDDTLTFDECLHHSKPALASFMSRLSWTEIAENEGSAFSCVCELYHSLLRERNWALIHLTLNSLGYFAAWTSCKQLWRFVPFDAALSFDIETGTTAVEERLMSELKRFLEKEGAIVGVDLCKEQLGFLVKEGHLLNLKIDKVLKDAAEKTETNSVNRAKKMKLLTGEIDEGVSLLQKGLTAIADALAKWREQNGMDFTELQHQLSSELSCLKNIVSYLGEIVDKG